MARNWVAWTPKEYRLLDQVYPTGGSKETQAALAAAGYQRTIIQIKAAADRRGLRTGHYYHKFSPNRDIDNEIIKAYQRMQRGEIGAVKELARRLDRPYGWVKWRGTQIGMVKPRQSPRFWTPEEDDILGELAHLGLSSVQRELTKNGYQRSQAAILLRRERLRISTFNPDVFNASDVADLLGINNKTVIRWIGGQLLKAKKGRLQTPTNSPGEPQNWMIKRKDLALFLRNNPGRWDVRKVRDHYWIVELLAGPPE